MPSKAAHASPLLTSFASRDDRGQPVTREKSIVLTEPTLQKTRVTEKAETVIGAALAVGAWFLAHRHGRLRGMVDANKNGVGDRWNAGHTSSPSRERIL